MVPTVIQFIPLPTVAAFAHVDLLARRTRAEPAYWLTLAVGVTWTSRLKFVR